MTPDDRELIRSKLHQTDLVLRKIDRKAVAIIEQVGLLQGLILEIEDLKKPIYRLLNKGGGRSPRRLLLLFLSSAYIIFGVFMNDYGHKPTNVEIPQRTSPYCTVKDHMLLSRYGIHSCPKCGGSTQTLFDSFLQLQGDDIDG